MKRLKLRGYVLPVLYVLVMAAVFVGVNFLAKGLYSKNYDQYKFVLSAFKNNTLTVIEETDEVITKPFNSDKVETSIGYYDMKSDEETQAKSLIYYQNTYMENTGVLYTSDEAFDVLATMDGTVKNVKTDDILGSVIEVENSSRVSTIYYSVDNIKVKAGDTVKKNDAIATSGSNNIEAGKANKLLFEVYVDGHLVNPEEFYNMSLNELN